jgi:outer membrane protein TolC
MLAHSFIPLRCLRKIIFAALGLALACIAARAQTPGALEFAEALHLAEARSRALPAQEASATAAREMAVAAGRSPDAVLKFGINNLPIDGPDRFSVSHDFMTMRSVALSQEFTRADKRAARATRFEREADVALAGRAMVLANLQRDTALAWFERHYRERLRELLRAQRGEATLQIEAADTAYRTSRGSQADVFAARSAAAQIDDRAAQSERELATATTQLARWVGDAARAPLGPPPRTDTVALDATALDDELAHHPRIAMLGKQEDAARADADIARAEQRADWSAEVMVSQRGSAYSNMVSINLSIPLQWDTARRQDRELAAKLAATEQLHAQRDEALREHVAEVATMLQEWRSDRERLQRYDAALLPLAAERTLAALVAYRVGSGALGAVLEARRAEIDTRIERLKLELEAARLWVQLTYLGPTRSTP